MQEPTGYIRIVYNETVIQEKFYYTKRHRTRLFEEFTEFIKSRSLVMYIHVRPKKYENVSIPIKEEVVKNKPEYKKVTRRESMIFPDVKKPIVRPKAIYSNNKSLYG